MAFFSSKKTARLVFPHIPTQYVIYRAISESFFFLKHKSLSVREQPDSRELFLSCECCLLRVL